MAYLCIYIYISNISYISVTQKAGGHGISYLKYFRRMTRTNAFFFVFKKKLSRWTSYAEIFMRVLCAKNSASGQKWRRKIKSGKVVSQFVEIPESIWSCLKPLDYFIWRLPLNSVFSNSSYICWNRTIKPNPITMHSN